MVWHCVIIIVIWVYDKMDCGQIETVLVYFIWSVPKFGLHMQCIKMPIQVGFFNKYNCQHVKCCKSLKATNSA